MESQVESAISLAFDPRTDPSLKSQAYAFLDQLRSDPDGWQVCLSLFTRAPSSTDVVRFLCLEIVNSAVQGQRLDMVSLSFIRESLVSYIRECYGSQNTVLPDNISLQNKLVQTVTYLFTSLYPNDWPNFFDDFRDFARDGSDPGTFHPAGTILYLRVLSSVHDEIADQLISRTQDELKRSNELKDFVRARDVHKIAITWQEILSKWRRMDLGIVELCLRTIAKWVGWTDISLVVSGTIQSALLELAGQQGLFKPDSKEAKSRDAAIDTFTETVGKKMQNTDKIELIRYLSLASTVDQLIASPALSDLRSTPNYDTDLAETVAKLVNNVVYDVVKVLDTEGTDSQTSLNANELLQAFVPHLLRFFSDEYDEICSAVIPSLTDLITTFRKQVKSRGRLPDHYSAMLQPILDAIVAKMRYDDTATWGEEDEATDEAEFQDLRRKLHALQSIIAAVDENLYINTLSTVVAGTLTRLESTNGELNWRDLDLALHEMYLFGELAVKNGGLYIKGRPTTMASQNLIEMLNKVVESGLASFPHPAIQLQFMEICVRYVQYFQHMTTSIPKVLESFVTFVHSEHRKVRARSWYLFHRFVRQLRGQLGDVAQTVLHAIGDLLLINAELPEAIDADDASSDGNDEPADAAFNSQLFLFESIGCVASSGAVPSSTKVAIAKAVIDPLVVDLDRHLQSAKIRDERAILQIHHVIMAIGTLANGFSEWTPGSFSGAPPPADLSTLFEQASDAILMALEGLSLNEAIRFAARHSFSRLIGVLGARILPQLPRWIDGLLSSASSNDEMAMFLRALGQVVYSFKTDIHAILDRMLSPMLRKVFDGLAQPPTGTDDEIQLKELKQQYLSFLFVILNNDLAGVLVSPSNQASFSTIITSMSHFSCDPTDAVAAKLALIVLTRMTAVWGGPDLPIDGPDPPSPALPGFDSFILGQLAPLPWTLIATPGFDAGDAQTRNVLQEAASLLWTILRKTGRTYRDQIQDELRALGCSDEGAHRYLSAITGDLNGFRKFFASFIQQAKR